MAKKLQSQSQQKYHSLHPLRRLFIARFLKEVGEEVNKFNPEKILDVGCGEGQTARYFYEISPNLKIEGVDLDSFSLRLAKRNCPRMKTRKASVYKLPFEDHSFGLVICLEVLEHLENPQKALKEIKRVSQNQVIISVPHEPFFSLASFLSGKYWPNLGRHPDHRQFWTKKKFEQFLKIEFSQVWIKTAFPWLVAVISGSNESFKT